VGQVVTFWAWDIDHGVVLSRHNALRGEVPPRGLSLISCRLPPVRLNHPLVIAAAVAVGVALIVLAVVYWAEPASSLPSWIPGHEAGSGHHHVKHGIASFLLGVALLVFAWFQTGKKHPAGNRPV
jgi:hypothetical protein